MMTLPILNCWTPASQPTFGSTYRMYGTWGFPKPELGTKTWSTCLTSRLIVVENNLKRLGHKRCKKKTISSGIWCSCMCKDKTNNRNKHISITAKNNPNCIRVAKIIKTYIMEWSSVHWAFIFRGHAVELLEPTQAIRVSKLDLPQGRDNWIINPHVESCDFCLSSPILCFFRDVSGMCWPYFWWHWECQKRANPHATGTLCSWRASPTFRIVRASVLQRWGQLPIAESPGETREFFRMISIMCLGHWICSSLAPD